MGKLSQLTRIAVALGLPSAILDRGAPLRGTKFLARAALRGRIGGARPFQMINVGACDGVLFDDVTPWLYRIANARAVLVEPIPYNQKRLRENYPDEDRFVIEPVAVSRTSGSIKLKTFNPEALEAGTLPLELMGCSSATDTNLMSGKDAWGQTDPNFGNFSKHLEEIDVSCSTLQEVLDRNGIEYIDAFLVDCEGADWAVFEQLDLKRYRPGLIKVEIGALPADEIGQVLLKLKTANYAVGLFAEDVWGFA